MEKIVSRLLIFSIEQFLDSYKESWDQTYFTTVPMRQKYCEGLLMIVSKFRFKY